MKRVSNCILRSPSSTTIRQRIVGNCFHQRRLLQTYVGGNDDYNNKSSFNNRSNNKNGVTTKQFIDFQNQDMIQTYDSYIDDSCRSLAILIEEENYVEARDLINSLVKLSPFNAFLYVKRASVIVNENIHLSLANERLSSVPLSVLYKKALNDLEISMKLTPKFSSDETEAERSYLFSQIYAYHGEAEKALMSIEKAIDFSSFNHLYLFQRGRVLMLLNRTDEALTWIEQSIFINPKDASSSRPITSKYKFLIDSYQKLNNLKMAHLWCNRAIHRSINAPLFYAMKAKLYRDLLSDPAHKKTDVIEQYMYYYMEKSLMCGRIIDDEALSAHRSVWRAEQSLKEDLPKQAETIINSALTAHPQITFLYVYKGIILEKLGLHKEALNTFEFTFSKSDLTDYWKALRCLSVIRCAAKDSDNDTALRAMQNNSKNPLHERVCREEYIYYFHKKDIDFAKVTHHAEAISIIDSLLDKVNRDSAVLYLYRGLLQQKHAQPSEASEDIRASVQLLKESGIASLRHIRDLSESVIFREMKNITQQQDPPIKF